MSELCKVGDRICPILENFIEAGLTPADFSQTDCRDLGELRQVVSDAVDRGDYVSGDYILRQETPRGVCPLATAYQSQTGKEVEYA